ncbi:hypothetical protein PAXINDRAFT_18487 [Paxillus involutus ATCC 200175]|uniref:Uncharacterized protein n=1 Tax=Paxillus involutus ATCC 200175 TaxID=664439 RepID=A0A0C9SYT7_PAXIN|nr:hypothetical protein PAXINDRAFT_18487 [Paxillus involutus ATCC 200175]
MERAETKKMHISAAPPPHYANASSLCARNIWQLPTTSTVADDATWRRYHTTSSLDPNGNVDSRHKAVHHPQYQSNDIKGAIVNPRYRHTSPRCHHTRPLSNSQQQLAATESRDRHNVGKTATNDTMNTLSMPPSRFAYNTAPYPPEACAPIADTPPVRHARRRQPAMHHKCGHTGDTDA